MANKTDILYRKYLESCKINFIVGKMYVVDTVIPSANDFLIYIDFSIEVFSRKLNFMFDSVYTYIHHNHIDSVTQVLVINNYYQSW